MAFSGDLTVSITLHFRDAHAVKSRNIMHIAANLLASAGNFGKAYAGLYESVTSCALWKVSISYRTIDSSSPRAINGALGGNAGIFLFDTVASTPERYVVTIPAVKASMVISDLADPDRGIGLKLTDPAIVALRDAYLVGLAGVAPVAPWNENGDPWGDGTEASAFNWSGVALTALARAYRGYEEISTD